MLRSALFVPLPKRLISHPYCRDKSVVLDIAGREGAVKVVGNG
jgi:hypothetical protein